MGKSNWDRQSGSDALILHSVAHFESAEPFFVLHRELAVSRHEAAYLTSALTNPAAFVALVPEFLVRWEREPDRLGLAALAEAIRTEGFLRNRAWRFNLVPGSFGVGGVDEYCFEIRLFLNLKEILPAESLDAAASSLLKMGEADDDFFAAFDLLKSRLAMTANYPGAVAVLNSVIGPPAGSVAY